LCAAELGEGKPIGLLPSGLRVMAALVDLDVPLAASPAAQAMLRANGDLDRRLSAGIDLLFLDGGIEFSFARGDLACELKGAQGNR
jgi:hypothetical protein